MKEIGKKTAAVLLSLILAVSFIPTMALAQEPETSEDSRTDATFSEDTETAAAVVQLSKKEVFSGDIETVTVTVAAGPEITEVYILYTPENSDSGSGERIDAAEQPDGTYAAQIEITDSFENGFYHITAYAVDAAGQSVTGSEDAVFHVGHDWNEGEITTEPTCTEEGERTFTCNLCNEVMTEPAAAAGHSIVEDPAVAASCANTGLTAGSHCFICGEIITAQEEIPMIPHAWDEGRRTKEPSYGSAGVMTYTCTACGETKTGKIPALEKTDLSQCTVTLGETSCTYTGEAKEPVVTVKYGNATLIPGTDYDVAWSNNINAGTAAVIITGKGRFTKGPVTKTFTIKKAANRISVNKKTVAKTGNVSRSVSFSLGARSSSGELEYKSDSKYVKVSTAGKVTIKKNFCGKVTLTVSSPATTNYKAAKTVKVTLIIKPGKMTVRSAAKLNGKKLRVTWAKQKGASSYQVQCARNRKFTSGMKQLTVTGASGTFKELKNGRAYYVRIRAYNQTTKKYGAWSKAYRAAVSEYNYLAIGNSITGHGICGYWWNNIGMAASTAEKDYVHLVTKYFDGKYDKVNADTFSFVNWEAETKNRSGLLGTLDSSLSSELDLVTIELSENVPDTDTFKKDFSDLVKYVKKNAPNARIIIVDDFWDTGKKSAIKKKVAAKYGLAFADLSKIKQDVRYQCGMGTTVYDASGNPHTVNNEFVAVHPGDRGMKYIANRIIKLAK